MPKFTSIANFRDLINMYNRLLKPLNQLVKTIATVSLLIQAVSMQANAQAIDNETSQIQNSTNVHPNISAVTPDWCKIVAFCGDLVKIDCQSSIDGPLYYFNNKTGNLLMKCGGYCLRPKEYQKQHLECEQCPPAQWKTCQNIQ